MLTIHLHEMIFEAYHGLYNEESILGGTFSISLDIVLPSNEILELQDTLDYVKVYDLIKNKMNTPVKLLEVLAKQLTDEIHQLDEKIQSIKISIKKLNPPIKNFEGGNVGISLETSYMN